MAGKKRKNKKGGGSRTVSFAKLPYLYVSELGDQGENVSEILNELIENSSTFKKWRKNHDKNNGDAA